MLFNYKTVDEKGQSMNGAIDAVSLDSAISGLQRRGLTVISIHEAKGDGSLLNMNIAFLEHVSNKEVVILSRQLSTLFQAQVSALRIFRLLGGEAESKVLGKKLLEIADDLQSGSSISVAMSKHPKVFSEFYVSMIKAGEESGKLDETFAFLADYLDRTYALVSKAKSALIYPAFVVFTMVTVMILMFTVVIPKIATILIDSGQKLPIYTSIILSISNLLVHDGIYIAIVLIIVGFFFFRYVRTTSGRIAFDQFKLAVPYVGTLYSKLYLSRLADNMNTMLASGIPMIRSIELTSSVIDNVIYKKLLGDAVESVKGGKAVSEALSNNKQIPGIMIQMMKVGEETGDLGNILKTLANFYSREVVTAVDNLVDLIEPAMIVLLGLGVGVLVASVLVPIYNISSSQ